MDASRTRWAASIIALGTAACPVAPVAQHAISPASPAAAQARLAADHESNVDVAATWPDAGAGPPRDAGTASTRENPVDYGVPSAPPNGPSIACSPGGWSAARQDAKATLRFATDGLILDGERVQPLPMNWAVAPFDPSLPRLQDRLRSRTVVWLELALTKVDRLEAVSRVLFVARTGGVRCVKLVVDGQTFAFHGLPLKPIDTIPRVSIDDGGAGLRRTIAARTPSDLVLEACQALDASALAPIMRIASGRNVLLSQMHCW